MPIRKRVSWLLIVSLGGASAVAFLAIAEFLIFFNTGPLNAAIAGVTALPLRSMAFAVNIFVIQAA